MYCKKQKRDDFLYFGRFFTLVVALLSGFSSFCRRDRGM